ncbi:hypothetical protein OH77DRAFT_593598 [Trametes cingulata]|nr:hypothetical protein OH77DRAFT_593598 [Trametes cingulata]
MSARLPRHRGSERRPAWFGDAFFSTPPRCGVSAQVHAQSPSLVFVPSRVAASSGESRRARGNLLPFAVTSVYSLVSGDVGRDHRVRVVRADRYIVVLRCCLDPQRAAFADAAACARTRGLRYQVAPPPAQGCARQHAHQTIIHYAVVRHCLPLNALHQGVEIDSSIFIAGHITCQPNCRGSPSSPHPTPSLPSRCRSTA